MRTQNRIRIANDNAPSFQSRQTSGGVPAQHSADSVLDKRLSPRPKKAIPDMLKSDANFIKNEPTQSLKLTLGCWLVALVTMISTFALGLGTGPKILASIALLWMGLWSSYVSADHGYWRLSEISVVAALAGLMGAATTSANYFGLGLTFADGLMMMSIFPIVVGYLLKSRICVLASICASLIWGALSFSGLVEMTSFMFFFPAICASQLFMATKIRSGMAITLAVITGYYWAANCIFTTWSADNLPLTFAATALFAIGAAHHRSGKAAEDKRLTGSSIHIYAGWITAMIGAIGFQYFWLNPEALQSNTATLTVSGLGIWKGVILASLATVFCSAIIRYKHSQISLAGIFLVTVASALIPMMLWFPTWPQKTVAAIPGVTAMPTIGVFIGAALMATALGMVLNGIRRHSPLMIGLGISAIFAEAYLLIKPELMTIDNSVIFITGFLSALAVGAAIAGSSLAHQAPAPRLKHS